MQILFEDNHLLVINKPTGWVSQGSLTDEHSVVHWAATYLKEKYHKPGNVFVGVVSRLDRLVSGVLPLARTSKAASRLSDQIRQRTMDKRYWAIVQNEPPKSQDLLTDWLYRPESATQTVVVDAKHKQAQQAQLTYSIMRRVSLGWLLEIDLITGRKHQIRCQLEHLGCPIVGDQKYGSTKPFGHGIALHCRSVEFKHPTKEEVMRFEAEVPSSWRLDV